jgi:hypothetical protein
LKRRAALALALSLAALAPPARAGEPAFAVLPAAVIDVAPFSWSMPLMARPSQEGVSHVLLSPEVLAASRPDMADLRVVDASSRQWPYLIREDVATVDRALGIAAPAVEAGRSRYALGLPVGPLVVDRLTVRVDRAIFDRVFQVVGALYASGAGDGIVLARGRLARAAGAPAEVVIALSRARVDKLALVVEDGDEAPLPLAAARVTVPVPELVLVAPAGAYTLVTGEAEARPPRYEIAGARDQVLAAPAGEAEAGPLARNPRHREPVRVEEREQWALWGAMALAVALLGALALRLARREGQGGEGKKAEAKTGGGEPPA